jgi:GAF domain
MDFVRDVPLEAERGTANGRTLLEGKIIHIPDVLADPDYTWAEAQRLGGYRTVLGVPMLREGIPIGVLTLTHFEVRPFTDHPQAGAHDGRRRDGGERAGQRIGVYGAPAGRCNRIIEAADSLDRNRPTRIA